jgi:aldose sugar dehydrogenase
MMMMGPGAGPHSPGAHYVSTEEQVNPNSGARPFYRATWYKRERRYTLEAVLRIAIAVTALFAALSLNTPAQQGGVDPRPPNAPDQKPSFPEQTRAPEEKLGVAFDVVTVADGLQNPWGLAFLPDGRMLVSEKPGRLRIVGQDGTLSEPVAGLPPVDARGQGGLLALALDPRFANNGLVYWSYAEPRDDGSNNTAVARGRLTVDAAPRVENAQVIFHQVPSLNSRLHFGSRLVWRRDGTLFVTLGDRSITEGRMQAQRLDGLLGKVVRINADGSVPKDNPLVGKEGVRPEIWSIGHRNIQAATLHPSTGELWEVEHGTRGGDELNVVKKGKDYGWPTIAYGIEYKGGQITGGITQKAGMEQAVYYWDPVIAPSGMVFYTGSLFPAWKGSLFIGGLGSTNLVRLTVKGEKVTGEERLLKDLKERIRDVVQGPDGALYLLTDNAKGRVVKLVPRKAGA